MGRTIKTRHIQKDIKVLDKTVTAAEHMKGSCFCYSCRRLDRGADPADRHPVWRIVQYGRRK